MFTSIGVTLQETDLPDLVLLGSPVLLDKGVDEALASKRGELERLVERLQYMPAHDSLFLLRNLVTSSRLLYTLRTTPCMGRAELVSYDELVRSALTKTLNTDITNMGWLQASLPVRWGGLGVRSAVMLAPSAYLASAASTQGLVGSILPQHIQPTTHASFTLALDQWVTASSTAPPTAPYSGRQRAWDDPCCRKASDALLRMIYPEPELGQASTTHRGRGWRLFQ